METTIVYGENTFHIADGFCSIKQIKEMLAVFEKNGESCAKHIKNSMRQTKSALNKNIL